MLEVPPAAALAVAPAVLAAAWAVPSSPGMLLRSPATLVRLVTSEATPSMVFHAMKAVATA
ncbi:Uncharacterised protein [Mycobacteroides abscessus subsp. massiliense]|nr:Uncharacterised protein [Mycobacteroides abscessus subsp. massiliense]SKQ03105.1 Uncharacterised protein [Mycobacteroides abscessus subsp. massiliense]SKW92274.1 Uncharacterised protein [Mycobacteroides abscessus subsp. massiliense]